MRTCVLLLVTTITVAPCSCVFAQCQVADFEGSADGDNLFGGSLGIYGDIAAISEPGLGRFVGGVFVFRRVKDHWSHETILRPPNPSPDDAFRIVDAGDGIVVVGAWDDSSQAPDMGAAHVFRYDQATGIWSHEAQLSPSDGAAADAFGRAVAVGHDVAIIGSPWHNPGGTPDAGAAYVFRFDGSRWHEEGKLVDPEGEKDDILGFAVDIHGDLAVVGGPDQGGHALVFRRTNGQWTLDTTLLSPGNSFGNAVAAAQDVVAIGRPFQDSDNGAVYVYRYDDSAWLLEDVLTASEPTGPFPQLGWSLSMSPDATVLFAGAPFDDQGGNEAGAVHLFRYGDHGWREIAKILASAPDPGAGFGAAIALHDDLGLVGAFDHLNVGHAYIFAGLLGLDCNANGSPDACDIFDGRSDDSDANSVPDECEVVGDVTGDGLVDVDDLIAVILSWGPCITPMPDCPGDVNQDGTVGVADLIRIIENWS